MIIKKLSALAILFAIITLISPTTYAKYPEGWEIAEFNAEITLNSDGSVDVNESILADFTNEAHRGLLRSIPYRYQTNNGTHTVNFDFYSATDNQGAQWDTETYKKNGYFNIEMRTRNNEPTNERKVFNISYTINNVINFFETHDEFYWNINGTDWPVPTKIVNAKVHLPDNFAPADLQVTCYTGAYGEPDKNCNWNLLDQKTIRVQNLDPLAPYENLTIVVGTPRGTVTPPSFLQKTLWFLTENWPITIAPVTLIIMLSLWYKKGRDDKTVRDTVIPHYKPPKDLLPTETGTIIDEKIHPQDITSSIINLAVKGYIRIHETEKKHLMSKSYEYELELIKPYTPEKPFEKLIYNELFPLNRIGDKKPISELEYRFYTKIPMIKKEVMRQLVTDGYFPESPTKTKKKYSLIGGIIIAACFIIGENFPSALICYSIMVSGAIISIVGSFMPKKTKKGTETYYQLKGLYEYIKTAEKDRMKFQEENNIMFERLLPYAISFGLAKKWAAAFDGLITKPPGWYHPAGSFANRPFTMMYFSDRLNRITDRMTSNLVSGPGGKSTGGWSGGSGFSGGFSGGGFGGGGGRGL